MKMRWTDNPLKLLPNMSVRRQIIFKGLRNVPYCYGLAVLILIIFIASGNNQENEGRDAAGRRYDRYLMALWRRWPMADVSPPTPMEGEQYTY